MSMSIEEYSLILSVCVLLLGGVTLFSIFGYFCVPKVREKMNSVAYTTWLKAIGVFATIATIGALTYQYRYLTPVCLDCWWQRIFMFPIEIIIVVSLFTKTRTNHLITGLMASIGLIFSILHYSKHFQKYVIGNPTLVPCSPSLSEPLCGLAPTVTFGFITIPFMALVTFVTLIWLSYLAHQKSHIVE